MLITAVITLAGIITWAVTARALFRRWVRNEAFAKRDQYIDRSGFHDRVTPRSHKVVAGYAISTALILPVLAIGGALLLPIRAFTAFVMRNPPLSRSELAAKTQALEAENARLRQEQDSRADAVTCPDCGQNGSRPDARCARCYLISLGPDPREARCPWSPPSRTAALARLGIPARGDSHHYGTD